MAPQNVHVGEARPLRLVLLFMLAVQTTSALSSNNTYPSCLREWFVSLGIPDAAAQEYEGRPQLYKTIGVTVRSLSLTHFSYTLKKLGITEAAHRDAILACASNRESCPLDPCLNSGTCMYSDTGRSFMCSCQKSWGGDRCETKTSGRITKSQMRSLIKQQRKKLAWFEGRLNATESAAQQKEQEYARLIAQQQAELRVLRTKIEMKGARNKERRAKLVNTRRRASNSSREAQACKRTLEIEMKEKNRIKDRLSVCRAELGFPFTATGCGNRKDGRDGLATRQVLAQGNAMVSKDGRSRLVVLPNGTVQASDEHGVFWSSPDRPHSCRRGNGPYRLYITPNGEMRTLDHDNCVMWSSGGRGGSMERNTCLWLGNSRRLTLYAPCGQMLWTTGQDPNRTT